VSGPGSCGGQADNLISDAEPGVHLTPVLSGAEQVAAGPEVWGDAGERGQEPLRSARETVQCPSQFVTITL
jgi:hypothetical protein